MFIPWVNKVIYPKENFVKDIRFSAGNPYSVEFTLCTTIPQVRIWLNVINLSQFLDINLTDINIRHLSINAGGNHCLMTNKDKIVKDEINKKSIGNIYAEFDLSEKHIQVIGRINEPYNLTADLSIDISLESKLYKHTFNETMQNISCRLNLSRTPVSYHKEMLLRCNQKQCEIAKDYENFKMV